MYSIKVVDRELPLRCLNCGRFLDEDGPHDKQEVHIWERCEGKVVPVDQYNVENPHSYKISMRLREDDDAD